MSKDLKYNTGQKSAVIRNDELMPGFTIKQDDPKQRRAVSDALKFLIMHCKLKNLALYCVLKFTAESGRYYCDLKTESFLL